MSVVSFPKRPSRIWLQIEPEARAILARAGLGTEAIGLVMRSMEGMIARNDLDVDIEVADAGMCRPQLDSALSQATAGINRVTAALLYEALNLMICVYAAGGELP